MPAATRASPTGFSFTNSRSSSYEWVATTAGDDDNGDSDEQEQPGDEESAFELIGTNTQHKNNNNNNNNNGKSYRDEPADSQRNGNLNGDGIFHDYRDDDHSLPNFTIDDDDDDFDDNHVEYEHAAGGNSVAVVVVETAKSRAPPNYICPLTLQLMSDPMNDACGHTFDRQAILDWIEHRPVCPISRRPMDRHDLFHNGHLKAQIEEWKDRHPGYSADNESDILDIEHNHSHSQFELMLLAQERSVLNVVKVRARARRKRREFSRCMWCIGVTVTIFVVVVTVVALKFMDVRLMGPL